MWLTAAERAGLLADMDETPMPLDRLHDETVDLFLDRFGREPVWVAAAPGRVNLIGEHTDYNDGFVLPIAIDRWTVVAAAPADGSSRIVATDLGDEVRVVLDAIDDPGPPHWSNYVIGVTRQYAWSGASVPEFDLLVHSSIPIGAGLSSSAALEVATALVVETAIDDRLDALGTALVCQQAEHEFARTPCGIMDMYVALLAEPGHAVLIDCRDHRATVVPMPPGIAVLVVDTGIEHDLASGDYADRRASCAAAGRALGLSSLREGTLSMLESDALSDVERRRAAHVITENTRVLLTAKAMGESEMETVGDLCFASHDSLRDLCEVSCPELDTIVARARELRGGGVIGARMTGGGFGGSAIVLCEDASVARIATEMTRVFSEAYGRSPRIFRVQPTGPAALLS